MALVISIDEPLQLGASAPGLVKLGLLPPAQGPNNKLTIILRSAWFDLSMLTVLAHTILRVVSYGYKITLDVTALQVGRVRFLNRVGFFELVTSAFTSSEVVVLPALGREPISSIDSPINFTPLIKCTLADTEFSVQGDFERWESALKNTQIFGAVKRTDVIRNGELFYVLVWELIQNAKDHARSQLVTIASQFFIPSSALLQETLPLHALSQLAAHFRAEAEASALAERQRWLRRHAEGPFVMISVVDHGVGIPDTVRGRSGAEHLEDDLALAFAFDEDGSSKRIDPALYDVHGLSQILRIVQQHDGFLYAQSGRARAFGEREKALRCRRITDDYQLPGSIFQILVPLRRDIVIKRHFVRIKRSGQSASRINPWSRITIINELYAFDPNAGTDATRWANFVEHLLGLIKSGRDSPVILDLVGWQPSRQFLGAILRAIGKRRVFAGVIAVNASQQILAMIRTLPRTNAALQISEEALSNTDYLDRANLELATTLNRGLASCCLPILLPVTRVSLANDELPGSSTEVDVFNGMTVEVEWLGLGGLSHLWQTAFLQVFDYLFKSGAQEQEVDILGKLYGAGTEVMEQAEEFAFRLKYIAIANPNLLRNESGLYSLVRDADEIRRNSFTSLRNEIEQQILPLALHKKNPEEEYYCYSLGWHRLETRFRRSYYELWRVLATPRYLQICAEYLLRCAFVRLDGALASIRAVVSVTPTAGLLARHLAARLQAEFWEATSVVDLERTQWLPYFKPGESVLAVCDMFDTGSLTTRLVRVVEERHGTVIAVLALVRNKTAILPEALRGQKIISGAEVDLGDCDTSETRQLIDTGNYYEIDPHTLKPVRPDINTRQVLSMVKSNLQPFIAAGVIEVGHFLHSGHHYPVYFNLRHALKGPHLIHRHIMDWIYSQMDEVVAQFKATELTIVFPYYSSAYLFVDIIKQERFSAANNFKLRYLVAKPYQRPQDRLVYALDHLEDANTRLGHTVILDDGIASGATLAALLDIVVTKGADSVRSLAIIDRIGTQPRRHLRHITSYASNQGKEIPFCYRSLLRINLATHNARTCPYCIAAGDITQHQTVNGLVALKYSAVEQLLLPAYRSSLSAVQLCKYQPEEIGSLLGFWHAVFGALPVGNEIGKLIDETVASARTRLLCMVSLLTDKTLDRQALNKDEYGDRIQDALQDIGVDCDDRCRFLLQLPYFCSQEFAEDLLLRKLPKVYEQLAYVEQEETKRRSVVVDEFFAARVEEFACLSLAIAVLKSRRGPSWPNDALEIWANTFDPKGSEARYSSVFLFELYQIENRAEAEALENAKLLIYNFLTSYSGHPEAYSEKIFEFLFAIANGDYADAKIKLPPALFENLLRSIEIVSDARLLPDNVFTVQDFKKLRGAYETLCNANGADELVELFTRHFEPEEGYAEHATIVRMLLALAPRLEWVLEDAKVLFCEHLGDKAYVFSDRVTWQSDVASAHVLFSRQYLAQTIAHILLNCVQNSCGKSLTGAADDLAIRVSVQPTSAQFTSLAIRIANNWQVPQDFCIENIWHQGGGLSVQLPLARRYGADIKAERTSDGHLEFSILLNVIKIQEAQYGEYAR